MAREKRTAHKSPNSLADAKRSIISSQMKLVRQNNISKHRHSLVFTLVPEETPALASFSTQTIETAQKPQHQHDLEKAGRILTRRFNVEPITQAELDWAKATCDKEAKVEQAELEETKAAEMKKQQWQQDQGRRMQETNAANRDRTWTARMLLRVRLGDGDKSDSGSDSDLSSGVSDVAMLDPDRIWREESEECNESSALESGDDDGGEEEKEDTVPPQAQPQVTLPSPVGDANADMAAGENVVAEDSGEDIWDDDVWARIINVDEEY